MITMTDKAAQKITQLLGERDLSPATHGLRIAVSGGGCSGFMYHMEFAEAREDDNVYSHDGSEARVLVDAKSALLLGGSVVDYSDALTDAGFKVGNPQATDTCGCGQSFAV